MLDDPDRNPDSRGDDDPADDASGDHPESGEPACESCGEPVRPGEAVIAYPGLYHLSCYRDEEE